jgi:hypothetical protein
MSTNSEYFYDKIGGQQTFLLANQNTIYTTNKGRYLYDIRLYSISQKDKDRNVDFSSFGGSGS